MDDAPKGDLRALRLLRGLVIALLLVMILGFLGLIALFVTRFTGPPDLSLPAQITLPDGAEPYAFTQGETWWAVVTTDDRILIYDRETGTRQQTIQILRD